jgi:DNA ligase (NAD+)
LSDYNPEKLKSMTEQELADAVRHHNSLYEQNTTVITDEEFDSLVRQLTQLNPDNPALTEFTSPDVASSGKIKHAQPMLSLDKAYSLEEIMVWARKYIRNESEELLIQPKYDGISANYSHGVLATRGDGEIGENISDKLPLIELESKDYIGKVNRSVRGEIVIRNDDFKNLYSNIRKKNGTFYKNSRNAVAGIMGLKEIDEIQAQGAKLTLVDYELYSYTVKYSELENKWLEILTEIEALPYPMDGIVVKLADEEYSNSLGSTAHHPRGQIAFKFSGVRRETKLLNVNWSFGKNCLTPVAELEPVDIGGITIKHASLHNYQNVIDKDIMINDTVTVERAGDVIPYIVSSEPSQERHPFLIENCPCCGSRLEREGPEIKCINPDCFETRLQRLLAAVKNIGIERLGEPNIRRMMQHLSVKTLRDIFDLAIMDILKLEGFKQKSANNLYREIQNARHVNDFQVLAALNIPNIGKNVAKSILAQYTLTELKALDRETLSQIDGIGPERAVAIETELKRQSDFLDELLDCVEMTPTKGAETKQTICFTGKMPEKRSYYEELAEEHGYSPVDQVNSDLGILVALDPASSSSKIQKAQKANVKIMALQDWLDSLKNESPAPTIKPENSLPEDDLFAQAETEPEKQDDNFNDLPLFNC